MEEDIKMLEEMIKEYKQFGDLDNPDYEDTDRIYKAIETVLNLVKKQQEEIEKKDKLIRDSVKGISRLKKQKEFNKLTNTVKSYKGQFKRQQKEIDRLLKDNRELGNKYFRKEVEGSK